MHCGAPRCVCVCVSVCVICGCVTVHWISSALWRAQVCVCVYLRVYVICGCVSVCVCVCVHVCVCVCSRVDPQPGTLAGSQFYSKGGFAKRREMLLGFMYRTKCINGICRMALFSNVSSTPCFPPSAPPHTRVCVCAHLLPYTVCSPASCLLTHACVLNPASCTPASCLIKHACVLTPFLTLYAHPLPASSHTRVCSPHSLHTHFLPPHTVCSPPSSHCMLNRFLPPHTRVCAHTRFLHTRFLPPHTVCSPASCLLTLCAHPLPHTRVCAHLRFLHTRFLPPHTRVCAHPLPHTVCLPTSCLLTHTRVCVCAHPRFLHRSSAYSWGAVCKTAGLPPPVPTKKHARVLPPASCTGLAPIAGALCVELLASPLQYPQKTRACAPPCFLHRPSAHSWGAVCRAAGLPPPEPTKNHARVLPPASCTGLAPIAGALCVKIAGLPPPVTTKSTRVCSPLLPAQA